MVTCHNWMVMPSAATLDGFEFAGGAASGPETIELVRTLRRPSC
jgi:hypothetical protein